MALIRRGPFHPHSVFEVGIFEVLVVVKWFLFLSFHGSPPTTAEIIIIFFYLMAYCIMDLL